MVREQGTPERAAEGEERALPSATPPPRQEERQDETSGSKGEGSPPPRRSMAEVYDLSDGEEGCSPSVSVDDRSHGGTPSRRTRGGSREVCPAARRAPVTEDRHRRRSASRLRRSRIAGASSSSESHPRVEHR